MSAPPARRRVLILYASQTGTAEDLSLQLSDTLARLHWCARVLALDSFTPSRVRREDDFSALRALASHDLVLFVVSTTGQGDMPDNGRTFWRNLRVKGLGAFLAGTPLAVFGCGDSTYAKFCWAARKLRKRVLDLGGSELLELRTGDQSSEAGVEGAFADWTAALQSRVLQRWPLPDGCEAIPGDVLLPPKWTLELLTAEEEAAEEEAGGVRVEEAYRDGREAMERLHAPRAGAIMATVARNERVTAADHWQDVRRLTFALPAARPWTPGDVLALAPKNFAADVDAFLALQGWAAIADRRLRLRAPDAAAPCPVARPVRPTTLRTLLTHHLDITAVPRRSFFALAAALAADATHAERLRELADPVWAEELYDYTTRPRRSLLEVLQDFGSVRIGLDRLLEVVPRMRERLFSIAGSMYGASSSLPGLPRVPHSDAPENGDAGGNGGGDEGGGGGGGRGGGEEKNKEPGTEVDLLVAVVRYRTVIKKLRQGVCTRWLASLRPGDAISLLFEPGSLCAASPRSAPPYLSTPAIMIGPGTGVAPLRALLWERILLRHFHPPPSSSSSPHPQHSHSPHASGAAEDNLLFFGCRNEAKDYFFAAEWAALASLRLATIHVAFSRDPHPGARGKRYVQTLLREQAAAVWDAVHRRHGTVYVCGSSGRMPTAVREALVEIFEREGGREADGRGGDGGGGDGGGGGGGGGEGGGGGAGRERWSRERAEKYLDTLEKEGRFRQETW